MLLERLLTGSNLDPQVRVPAVCLYAHKLAYLVGESLNDDPISRIVSCFEVLVSRYDV